MDLHPATGKSDQGIQRKRERGGNSSFHQIKGGLFGAHFFFSINALILENSLFLIIYNRGVE